MDNKLVKSILGWFVFILVVASLITFAVRVSLHADHVAKMKHDFKVVCEFQGGHIATLDEGESFVCIKGGKVIDRG